MRPLSVSELLTVWERGLAELPFERALTILSSACPEASRGSLVRMSIGRRDADLLQLREWTFGPELTLLAACPACGQTLESVITVAALRAPVDPACDPAIDRADDSAASALAELTGCCTWRDYEVRFRSPNTEDIARCAGLEPDAGWQKLLGSCITSVHCRGVALAVDDLPEDVARKVVEEIGAVDPQADTRLDLTCPECRQQWKEVFDIVSFFWKEIDAWARRTLCEVHILARAYGWRENDVLALSAARREVYLAMAQA